MEKKTNYNAITVSSCVRNHIVSKNTYVCNIILTYCLQDTCKKCFMPNISCAQADISKIQAVILQKTELTKKNGCESFYVNLIGGDSFTAWDKVIQLSEWLWSDEIDMKVMVGLTLCRTMLTEEMQLWILENAEKIHIHYRCNQDNRYLWKRLLILRTELCRSVNVCISKEMLPDLEKVVYQFLKARKVVHLEIADLNTWTASQTLAYTKMITNISYKYFLEYRQVVQFLSDFSCWNEEKHNEITVDCNGYEYACRFCSPERMTYSMIREFSANKNETGSGCLLGSYYLNKNNKINTISKFHHQLQQQIGGQVQ